MPRMQPAYLQRRMARPHPFNADGVQVIAPSVALLTAAERRRVPSRLATVHASLPGLLRSAPAPFEWLGDALSERVPVVELSRFEDREYWHVRWTRAFEDSVAQPCVGCDADPVATTPLHVPPTLAWLRNTFGTFGLVAEQSGTAPMGHTLREIVSRERAAAVELQASLAAFSGVVSPSGWSDRFADLPPGSDGWISLYEADGDWVFADVEHDETVWLGGEWTGDAVCRIRVPWARAAAFILQSVINGGSLRPDDLRALNG